MDVAHSSASGNFQNRIEPSLSSKNDIDVAAAEKEHPVPKVKQPGQPSQSTRRIVILASALQRPQLRQLAAVVGSVVEPCQAKIVTQPSEEVTHLVVALQDVEPPQCKRTYKYFWAVSRGLWVVRPEWLEQSAKMKRWVGEEAFEVGCGTAAPLRRGHSLSTLYRMSRARGEPGIFAGKSFFLGPFPAEPGRAGTFDAEQSRTLLELNGAVVLPVPVARSDGTLRLPASIPLGSVVVVGHPNDMAHLEDSCDFCYRMWEHAPDGVYIVEAAWIMACLQDHHYAPYEGRLLNRRRG